MRTLLDLGVTVQRSLITNESSVTIGGTAVSQTHDKLTKLFKKELQTGDAEFDKLVYITTDTPNETAAFLQSPEIRAAIALAIDTG